MNWVQLGSLLWTGTVDTLYMTFWSSLIAYLIGLPLGVLLVVTRRDGIMPFPGFNSVLGVLINFLRSIPFIIMLAMLFPVTRAVMGTAIGTRSIIFPLVISAFPYVARMVESSLEEVDHGIIEAAQSHGLHQLPDHLQGAAAGIRSLSGERRGHQRDDDPRLHRAGQRGGGGGLGALAITKGLNVRKFDIMYSASLLLVVLVQIITVFGTRFTRGLDHKKR